MPHSQEIDANDVLQVRGLNVTFSQQQQAFSAVRDLSFTLRRGETLAIVGESGSGKSVTSLALMRLLDRAVSEVRSDALLLRRRNRQVIELSEQSDADMRGVRGADMAMIFQEPMTSLNPVFTIGEQIAESIRLHQGLKHDEALREAKNARSGTHSGSGSHAVALSASAVRRDASAGDDRHGALLPSGGADCR